MKKSASLLSVIICLSLILSGCDSYDSDKATGSSVISDSDETEFYNLVRNTKTYLDAVADAIYTYWYDSVYNYKYNGDINYAIESALEDNADNIETIERNTEEIRNLYGKIKNGKLSREVKEVIRTYGDYRTFVLEVSGSFNTYSAELNIYRKSLSDALSALFFEL